LSGPRAPQADEPVSDVDVRAAVRAFLYRERALGERKRRIRLETVRRQIAQIAQAERETWMRRAEHFLLQSDRFAIQRGCLVVSAHSLVELGEVVLAVRDQRVLGSERALERGERLAVQLQRFAVVANLRQQRREVVGRHRDLRVRGPERFAENFERTLVVLASRGVLA
jgi:hypothetical protein